MKRRRMGEWRRGDGGRRKEVTRGLEDERVKRE